MKTTIIGLTTGLFLLFFVGVSSATVIYEFKFYDLSRDFDDFNIVLSYADYVTTTGMSKLPTTHSTSLGYSVMYAGTNDLGWWGLDDDGSASINGG